MDYYEARERERAGDQFEEEKDAELDQDTEVGDAGTHQEGGG
jgi:hypothetical protein